MELFRDKCILGLIEDLKKELRTRGVEDKEIPRFIFICGERILDDDGKLLDTDILEAQNNIRYLLMKNFSKYKNNGEYGKKSSLAQCVISEYLYTADKAIDILTFEEVLAEISEYIIIITESPGTYCELGAFVLNDAFADKTIIINEDNPEYRNSFITKGPIKKIEDQNDENVILHNGKETLKRSLELQDMIMKMCTKKVKYTPNLKPQELNLKSLIYEILNLTELFEPITAYELQRLYLEIKQMDKYTILNKDKHKINSLKRVIRLMSDMKVINNIDGYYYINKEITCYNTMFTINRKYINMFRTKYLCRVYKCEPERMKTFV